MANEQFDLDSLNKLLNNSSNSFASNLSNPVNQFLLSIAGSLLQPTRSSTTAEALGRGLQQGVSQLGNQSSQLGNLINLMNLQRSLNKDKQQTIKSKAYESLSQELDDVKDDLQVSKVYGKYIKDIPELADDFLSARRLENRQSAVDEENAIYEQLANVSEQFTDNPLAITLFNTGNKSLAKEGLRILAAEESDKRVLRRQELSDQRIRLRDEEKEQRFLQAIKSLQSITSVDEAKNEGDPVLQARQQATDLAMRLAEQDPSSGGLNRAVAAINALNIESAKIQRGKADKQQIKEEKMLAKSEASIPTYTLNDETTNRLANSIYESALENIPVDALKQFESNIPFGLAGKTEGKKKILESLKLKIKGFAKEGVDPSLAGSHVMNQIVFGLYDNRKIDEILQDRPAAARHILQLQKLKAERNPRYNEALDNFYKKYRYFPLY